MKIFERLWWFLGIGDNKSTTVPDKNYSEKGYPRQTVPSNDQYDLDDFEHGFIDDEFME